MSRPVIGLSAYRRSLSTPLGAETDLYTLDPAYTDCVARAGGLPLIVPHGEDADAILALIDGLVLTGGGDLHPEHYGEQTTVELEDAHGGADVWELSLVGAARNLGLPVLGICRGMQTMAVAAGGRMIQNLESQHGHPLIEKTPDALLGERHLVQLAADSRVAAVLGACEVMVNSIHHQAVVDAGDLTVTATVGAVVEALEASDGWPAIGVQWHPEKMPEPEQQALFRNLVANAAAYRDR